MRAFLALTLLAAVVQTGTAASDRPGPSLVRLDAIAADAGGRLVQDLEVEDFEILEQGVPRQIESVQFIRADGTLQADDTLHPIASSADERAEAGRDGARLFAIFLDEYHVSPGPAVDLVRAALNEFVEKRLGPRDLVLIAKPLDSLPNLRLTRDPAAIRDAIATFDGRKGDYTPRTAFERNYIAPDPARIDGVRTQIVTSALNAIASHLGALKGGRKTIILVSEGFAPPPRRRGAALPSIDTVIRSANRSSASIYPIDPRALADPAVDHAAVEPSDQDAVNTLRTLAADTDGHAILATAELGAGVQRIVSDSSGYYVIAFQPANSRDTGRFHAVDVRVKRPGVALRTRPGYWEPLPDAAAVLRGNTPAAPTLPRHASPLIRPWFGLTRADEGRTRVQFVWEPAARVPGDRSRAGVPARAILNVLDADGTLLFESTVDAAGGSRAVFDVAPGKVQLRIQIEDDSAKLLDTDVRELVVEPLAGPVALGTAQVLRARNALEFRTLDGNLDAVPVVTRQFSRAERLLIRVPAYASEGTAIVVAQLVSGMGQIMRELHVVSTPTSAMQSIDLPLSGLASGEYRVELTATSGGARAQDSIPFRVTP